MLPGVDRPALATIDPDAAPAGRAARRRRERRVPAAAPAAVRGDGAALRARRARASSAPRVGLLSIGEEESKGNELTREAHRLLKAAPVNFIGNVEGRDVYAATPTSSSATASPATSSLKTARGWSRRSRRCSRDELRGTFSSQVGLPAVAPGVPALPPRVDYSEYGGAPLARRRTASCIVGHGRSSAKAVRNAVAMACARSPPSDLLATRRAATSRAAAPSMSADLDDCLRLSRTGRAEGRHGPGAGRRVPESAATTFDEADAALGEPLERRCASRGPRIG